MRLKLGINSIWFFYAMVKIGYMFLALLVYARFTQLGDTHRYLSGETFGSDAWFYNPTHMMDFFAHGFSIFLGPTLANLPFVFLSLYGTYYAVERLQLNKKELFYLLLLLSLPSFGVWTSIASKEAVGVFFLGVILGFLFDYIKGNKKNYILAGLAFYLCAIFKPQYLIGIFASFVFVFMCKSFSLKSRGQSFIIFLFFVASFIALFVFRHQINELSFVMPMHFSLLAESTRENTIWVYDFDVFWNAPYGMFIGFFGPTVGEAISRPAHLLVFIESSMIVIIFSYALIEMGYISIRTRQLNVFHTGVFVTATLWILFVHYPFGVLNPGSAIRYRENFYAFLVILFYFWYIDVKRRYEFLNFQKS